MLRLGPALSLTVTFLVAAPALAQDPPPPSVPATPVETGAVGGTGFGSRGQVAVSGDLDVTFAKTSIKTGPTSSDATGFTFLPAGDFFITDKISIGGQVGIIYTSGGMTDTTTFRIGPRAGYNLDLTDTISFWPKLGFTYNTTSTSSGGTDVSLGVFTLSIYAPLLVHLAPHFFIGIGPNLDVDLSSSAEAMGVSGDGPETTVFGVTTTVGGWFIP